MAQKLTDKYVRSIEAPAVGYTIIYDTEIPGFALRVTSATARQKFDPRALQGSRAFIVNYRVKRTSRERRYTIGKYPAWSVAAAREEARELRKHIDRGEDPMAERHEDRTAPTFNDLADHYEEHHLPTKSETSQREDRRMLKRVRAELGKRKVADIRQADIAAFHRRLKTAPYEANRNLALLSKMFSLACSPDLTWRTNNPAKGVKRYPEDRRERYLEGPELARLMDVLAAWPDQQAANIIRLLLLTGARRGEVLKARWNQINFDRKEWVREAGHVKQRRQHRMPLSAPALQLLSDIKEKSESEYVFPGSSVSEPRKDIRRQWNQIRETAGLPDLRLHDLRHNFASILASAGQSLLMIGRLLGHNNFATTQRYSHLFEDGVRKAAERVGAVISSASKPSAEVVDLT